MHMVGAAFLEVILLFALIAATILAFRRINRMAGWLRVPSICRTGFALILTGTIWLLN
jgi:translocator protein